MPVETLHWRDGRLTIIDQTLLPVTFKEIPLDTLEEVWEAIKTLRVRGAPAIGVCAAFGVLVGIKQKKPADAAGVIAAVHESAAYLATSRPTAVNLFWALDRMTRVADENAGNANLLSGGGRNPADRAPDSPFETPSSGASFKSTSSTAALSAFGISGESSAPALIARIEAEAVAIFEEDKRLCRAIGEHGAPLIHDGDGVLTHCNAGGLATADYGTALAVMFRAHELGRRFHVFADETRPLLQGARLTAWELMQAGIDVTLICDNMAAQVMREGRVQLVIVGADRIAANGDTANKIGTYGVALIAKAHNIPFYVAAPFSTFDCTLDTGATIPIEQRAPEEITHGFNQQTAPDNIKVYNPAFDVTPNNLIAGIITEKEILRPPYHLN